jgi:hypothetical protein
MTAWKRALPAVVGLTMATTTIFSPLAAYAAGDDGPGDDDGPGGCHYDDDFAPANIKTANVAVSTAVAAQKKAVHANAVAKARYQHALKTKSAKDNAPAKAAYVKTQKALKVANARVASSKKRLAYLKTLTNKCTAGVNTPTGLVATAGDASVALSWKAVTSAKQYLVYRGATKVGTVTTAAFTDAGLTNGTQYTYTVRAVIGTSTSAPSAPVLVTPTAPLPPHQNGSPLTAPTGVAATATTPLSGQMHLTWNAVSGATGYDVFRDGTKIGASATTTYVPTGTPAGMHSYTIVATDGFPAEASPASAAVSAGAFTGKGVADAIGRSSYGTITVSLVVSGSAKTITGCWATYPTSGDSSRINAVAIPQLCGEVLTSQPTSKTGSVAAVSGASATSPAFNTSLQNALVLAGR